MEIGLQHISSLTVNPSNTAIALGSGDMPVLATPAMVALMENAAMLAVQPMLPEGATTVGGHINVSHLKPSDMGQTITAKAVLTQVEGKKLTFHVSAYQGDTLIGKGEHLRFIVNREKFLSQFQQH